MSPSCTRTLPSLRHPTFSLSLSAVTRRQRSHLTHTTPRPSLQFSFPPAVTLRQRYQLLGNSLSVAVVADLIRYLLTNPPSPAGDPASG